MFRFILNTFEETEAQNLRHFIGTGLFFLLTGLLILLVPEILVAFIASIFLFTGSLFFFMAWKIKKAKDNLQEIKIRYDE